MSPFFAPSRVAPLTLRSRQQVRRHPSSIAARVASLADRLDSLERILDFLRIDQEPSPTEAGTPPAYWPASGELRVDHLSAQHSKDGPLVLTDISFELKSGERVGVGECQLPN